jgi:hypothetical protein
MGQRNISHRDVGFAILYGRVLQRAGATFYFLGKKDLPKRVQRRSRLDGMTVVMSPEGTLVTAYRNPRALRKIKHKAKYDQAINHVALSVNLDGGSLIGF